MEVRHVSWKELEEPWEETVKMLGLTELSESGTGGLGLKFFE